MHTSEEEKLQKKSQKLTAKAKEYSELSQLLWMGRERIFSSIKLYKFEEQDKVFEDSQKLTEKCFELNKEESKLRKEASNLNDKSEALYKERRNLELAERKRIALEKEAAKKPKEEGNSSEPTAISPKLAHSVNSQTTFFSPCMPDTDSVTIPRKEWNELQEKVAMLAKQIAELGGNIATEPVSENLSSPNKSVGSSN